MVLSPCLQPSHTCHGKHQRIMDWERDTKDKKRMRKVIASVCDDLGLRHTDAGREFLEVPMCPVGSCFVSDMGLVD